MHGDEGDDQHGLKVHEVHDMQPALQSTAHHRVDLASGNSATGNALHIRPQQPGASAQASLSPPAFPNTTASGVITDVPLAVQKARVMTHAENPGQEVLDSSKGESSAELVIDLCSPVKAKQQSAQPEQRPQPQRPPQLQPPPQLQRPPQMQQSQLQQPPQLHASAAPRPAGADLLPQSLLKSPDLAAADDAFPELRYWSNKRCQVGKPTMAALHDLRPAGTQDDHCAQLTWPAQPELQSHLLELQGAESGLQGSEPEPQGHEPEAQCSEPEPQGSQPEPQSHECEAQCSEPEPQGHECEGQGHEAEAQGSEPEPQGMFARVKGLLQRQDCGSIGVDNGNGDTAPALTQAEVIEAQTADEEKPLVGFLPNASVLCVCLFNTSL